MNTVEQDYKQALRLLAANLEHFKAIAFEKSSVRKMQIFLLNCSMYCGKNFYLSLTRGKRILAETGDKSDVQTSQQSLPLQGGLVFHICTEKPLPEELCASWLSDANRLHFHSARPRILKYLAVALLFISLIPVHDRAFAPGYADGELKYAIHAPIEGVVTEIARPFGRVAQGEPVAILENKNLTHELKKATIALGKVQVAMQAAGGITRPQQNAQELATEHKRLANEVQYLQGKLGSQNITAQHGGIIDWKEDLQGAYVTEGEVLGTIQQEEQQLVSVDIPMADWIELKAGDPAVFVLDTSFKRLAGTISHIPPTPTALQSGPVYRIKVALSEPVPAGTAGTVSLKGQRINLLWYFFRKPLSYTLALIAV